MGLCPCLRGRAQATMSAAAIAVVLLAIIVYYLLAGSVGFYLVKKDKEIAVGNRNGANVRRIPERTLILCSLAGAWPMELLAMNKYRHKTVKQPFRTYFFAAAAANVVILC